MLNIDLTNLQKKYLICYHLSSQESNITYFATYFNCSRTNSKKILDRMLKIGVFYKRDNTYVLTDLGERLTQKILEERNKISAVLQTVFGQNEVDSIIATEEIITSENCNYKQLLLDKYRFICGLPKQKTPVGIEELKRILGDGKYPLLYKIFKHKINPKDSVISASMANFGFFDEAELTIGKKSFIILKATTLNKTYQGFVKQGHIAELQYMDKNNGAQSAASNEDMFYIPLDAIHTWQYLGQGIFCANAWLNNKAAVSIVSHTNKSNYLFLLNLYGLN